MKAAGTRLPEGPIHLCTLRIRGRAAPSHKAAAQPLSKLREAKRSYLTVNVTELLLMLSKLSIAINVAVCVPGVNETLAFN